MPEFIWLTAIESAEPVGVATQRIVMIEQKTRGEGMVVAVHLDIGTEIRVAESLDRIRAAVEGKEDPNGDFTCSSGRGLGGKLAADTNLRPGSGTHAKFPDWYPEDISST